LLLFFTIALDYLDRINGSFLAISAFAVLIGFEFSRYFFGAKRAAILAMSGEGSVALGNHSRKFAKSEASGLSDGTKSDTPSVVSWWHYLVAALILIATTAPSWLSRLHYFGNPFYYGAIQNFLWGDTYLGSMDSPRMLTARDYFASHSLLDAAGRFLLGCSKVFFAIPIDRERLPLLYFAALAGIWFASRQKLKPYLWLLLFYGLQMLPLAWTQPVNTTPRIPYAATQPFELFLAAIFVYWLWKKTQPDKLTESKNAASLIGEGSGARPV
jgi:hypothetical protein